MTTASCFHMFKSYVDIDNGITEPPIKAKFPPSIPAYIDYHLYFAFREWTSIFISCPHWLSSIFAYQGNPREILYDGAA